MPRDRSRLMLRALAARDEHGVFDNVFLLGGSHEARNNIRSQQDRALNLASALNETGKLQGHAVTVIGGGAAGATFAAAAALGGAIVSLVDEHEEPVTAQRWTSERYLHPNLYDWPSPEWDRLGAGLPLMDWSAGPASLVRHQLVAGFAQALHHTTDLELRTQTVVTELVRAEDGKTLVRAQDLRGMAIHLPGAAVPLSHEWTADVVVSATGFLPEPRTRGAGQHVLSGSYWRDHPGFANRVTSSSKPPVIVGGGDGAIGEAFECVLVGGAARRAQHYLPALLALATDHRLREAVLDLEAAACDRFDGGTLSLFSARSPAFNGLDSALSNLWTTSGTSVELRTRPPALGRNSFLLNRVLASRLASRAPGAPAVATVTAHRDTQVESLAALAPVPCVWRVGPRQSERVKLVDPAVDFKASAKAAADPIARGVVEDLLDATRRPEWDTLAGSFPSLVASAAPSDPSLEIATAERRGAHATAASAVTPETGWAGRVDVLEMPDDFVHDLAQLSWLCSALTAAGAPPWWGLADPEAGSLLSLDFVAAYTDLTPAEVAHFPETVLGLADVPFGGQQIKRVWVYAPPDYIEFFAKRNEERVRRFGFGASPFGWLGGASDVADLLSMAKVLATGEAGPSPFADDEVRERLAEALTEVGGDGSAATARALVLAAAADEDGTDDLVLRLVESARAADETARPLVEAALRQLAASGSDSVRRLALLGISHVLELSGTDLGGAPPHHRDPDLLRRAAFHSLRAIRTPPTRVPASWRDARRDRGIGDDRDRPWPEDRGEPQSVAAVTRDVELTAETVRRLRDMDRRADRQPREPNDTTPIADRPDRRNRELARADESRRGPIDLTGLGLITSDSLDAYHRIREEFGDDL